jgi:hypothetical protein
MLYLPPGWDTSPSGPSGFWGVEVAQLNYEGIWGPTLGLQAHPDHVTLAVQTGVCGNRECQYASNADNGRRTNSLRPLYAIPRSRMQLGVWHELIIHAHWATDSSGVIDVWHRVKGRKSWKQTVHLTGYPTVQVTSNGSYVARTTDKIGAYRGPSNAPVSVWLDGFSRSRSFAAATAHLP